MSELLFINRNKVMKRRLLFAALVIQFLNINHVFSQQISFNQIIYNSGKTITGFRGITQDHLGFIWLASRREGIYRYDGTEFVNFIHSDSNVNSLGSDHDECIFADSADIIWVGTNEGGLDRFNPVTNTFTHFRHDPKNISSLCNDSVTSILEDHLGNLWVGTYAGLDMFDRKAKVFVHYSHKVGDSVSLSDNKVGTIYEDRKGTLWIGCGSPFGLAAHGGLNRFNRDKGNFTQYLHDPGNPNSLAANKVTALLEDSKGNFWVGTSGNGLHIMDREKGTFKHFYYDSLHPENLSRPYLSKYPWDHITFIKEDLTGKIWIGSLLGGINTYVPETKKITHFGMFIKRVENYKSVTDVFGAAEDTLTGFTDFDAWRALVSRDGMIWITSTSAYSKTSLFNTNAFKKTVPFFTLNKPEAKIMYTGANTFYYDQDSVLWIGTDSGLIRKNLKLHTEIYYGHDPKNINSLSHQSISAIRVDKDKNLWLGTKRGLNKLDPNTGIFTRYMAGGKLKSSLINDTIESMCLDHSGNLWIGTDRGLDKMDIQNGIFTHFKLQNKGSFKNGSVVYCVKESLDNEIWAGAGEGLYRIDISTGTVTTILSNANVKTIGVDSKNNIWIGADTTGQSETSDDQSLYRFDRSRSLFVSFLDPNSRTPIKNVFDILEDDKKNLWVSTSDAILKINRDRDILLKYGPEYGVHHNNFWTGDNLKTRDGKLYFGDEKGYYSFFPDELTVNSQPELNFTSFKLNGREVVPEEGGTLQVPLRLTNEIQLSYNQNTFSLEFVGIDYQSAGGVKYLFMLENYEDTWHKYGTDNHAFYYNVPPGKYLFRVKSVNSNGGLSEKTMSIIITPPWWQTGWAYSLFILLFIGFLWSFIQYRSKKLRLENRILEEKVAHRTDQLSKSVETLKATQSQLIQSEKMASLGELTAGIAHEIQNPLNFMNNFSEVNQELLMEMKEEIDKGNFSEVKAIANDVISNEEKINHHGKRADAIVKGMLQHSRSSTSIKEATDINALAEEYLRLSYHGLRAKEKSFNSAIKTDFDQTIGMINIIPQDIGRVLLNLYNNAFYAVSEKRKQKPDGYEPTVSISTRKTGDKVEIRVKDNGDGIPQKVKDKIFQPFFTTKPAGQGTGLGLSLSYDIIKTHGGEINVETKEGAFTEFVIQIPIV
jgi:signal transduction histidine kinase/ligand-binding sensor domain-containing protein